MSVRLRPITEADLPDFVRWLNDPEVAEHMGGEAGSVTLQEEREWFARTQEPDYPKRHWAIEAEGRPIGNCSLSPKGTQRSAGFGIMIGEQAEWGKGYGTVAVQEVLRIGFMEMDLHRIELSVFPENRRGIRCYGKCGFRQEGYERQAYLKNGRWRDLVSMALLREEWKAQQALPAAADGEVAIRPYRPADHAAVLALWELAGFHPGQNDTQEAIARKLATQPGFFLVAEADGQLVGTVIGSLERGWGWVQRLAVHPEYRRRGIARQLLQEAERAHAALGAYRTVLLTHKDNEAAQALYRSAGYEFWDGVIVMGRTLTPAEPAGEEDCCGS